MMKGLVILFVTIFLVGCNTRKVPLTKSKEKDIVISHKIEDGRIKVKFQNNGQSTKYLFSEYLDNGGRFKYNSYIQSSKKDTLLFSYLPKIENLRTIKAHHYIVGENAIIKSGQTVYSFLEILPQQAIQISFMEDKLLKSSAITKLEFAIYDTVNFMKVKGIETNKEGAKLLANEANNYKVLYTYIN